jgi:hypothetical protein
MRRSLVLVLLVAGFMLASVTSGFAIGFGFYGDLGGGAGEAEWDSDSDSFDIDIGTGGGGFALDTDPISDKKFSYRMLLGYEAQILEDDDEVELDTDGLVIENVFAFSILRRPHLKLWAGPLVRFGFYSGETGWHDDGLGQSVRTEFDDIFEFGAGGVFGANFQVARSMILAPSVGIRYVGGAGEADITERDPVTLTPLAYYKDDLTFGATMVFLNLTVLFE